jgi:hypothetical protein
VIRSLVQTSLAIAAGVVMAAGLYWLFLNTPESTVWTLAVSAVLFVATLASVAVTLNAALLSWDAGWSRAMVSRAGWGLARFVLPLALVVASWWLFGRARGWIEASSGEISAWFIAQFGWSDVRTLIRGAIAVCEWLRWLVVPLAAATWLVQSLRSGRRAFLSVRALVSAIAPVRLAMATAVFALCLWAPWTYLAYWVPRSMSPSAMELAFAVTKFALLTLVGSLGVAILTRIAAAAAPRQP